MLSKTITPMVKKSAKEELPKKEVKKEMLLLAPPKEKEKEKEPERKLKKSEKQVIEQVEETNFFTRALSFKTFFVSHLLILGVGLIFLVGIAYFLHFEPSNDSTEEYSPVTRMPVSFNLEIASPEDDLLVNDPQLLVSGSTIPSGTVVISVDSASGDSANIGLDVNGQGEFSKIVPLSLGLNRLTVTAFDSTGNMRTVQKEIYYSEEEIDEK